MDKKWLEMPRYSSEYIDGVSSFLDFAYTKGRPQGKEILCPCAKCRNGRWQIRGTVFDHLIAFGFLKGYTLWVNHGERVAMPMDVDDGMGMDDEENCADDIDGLLHDRFRDAVEEGGVGENPNADARKFYNLLDEANQELYPGCKKFFALSFIIRLYLLKCLHGWSNVSFTALLELLKEAIPDLNIPMSFNKTKSMIRDLGLDYKKIDACPNDCMLYWKEHEQDTSCHICGASRWIESCQVDSQVENPEAVHKVSAKILRYFPLIPRLQRLFMCAKTAELMRWHEKERVRDGKLRHPADGEAWNEFDHRFPNFSADPRNIRLGLTSDGFNPYRTMSISYSIWPVTLMPYNLPPWLCMKGEYCMLSLIIPGPKSPGVNIDVYLQPLVDDLKMVWEFGVETYDASKKENFQLRAALMWTVSDFPAYAMLSGWSTKGKLACPCCNYGTNSFYLKHSRKMCYMDHRVFLSMDHDYRCNRRDFNGKEEHRPPPDLLEGTKIFELLENFVNSFGNMNKENIDGPWKKRSIFFELPYWKYNKLRHNLDMMHIEKNIFDSIIGTLLDIHGKTKDHVKARLDLQELGIRKRLQPKVIDEGKKVKYSKACFNMSKNEKSIFCGVLKEAKIPDGCAANISRCVTIAENKVSGYKSHDAHFMLHFLLQVAVRSTLCNQVAHPLIRLCSFFRSLCQKVIDVEDLKILEFEIAETLCQLERIFPPTFFDIMVHLPIHLPNEVRLGGPVQCRWMYSPERNLGRLKAYVRNRSRPEGSIAEGYVVEECLILISNYLQPSVKTMLNKAARNSDICDSYDADLPIFFTSMGRPIGGKVGKLFSLHPNYKKQAHRYILFNCDEAREYISEHENVINGNKGRRWSKAKSQSEDFIEWFKVRATEEDVPDRLKKLSRGPNNVARKLSGYIINGYKFHTRRRDAKRKTQNSGVTLVSITQSFASSKDENPITEAVTYYGAINEIIELDYYGNFKFVLFRCDWFEVEDDKYGLTCAWFNKLCFLDDPFVLASQVQQCFYIRDPYYEHRHYVMKTFPREVSDLKDQNESLDEAYHDGPSEAAVNLSMPDDNFGVEWVRDDIEPTIVESHSTTANEIDSESDSDFDATLADFMD